jgi:hypothetical protein
MHCLLTYMARENRAPTVGANRLMGQHHCNAQMRKCVRQCGRCSVSNAQMGAISAVNSAGTEAMVGQKCISATQAFIGHALP